jgi:heme exporter protein B
MGLGRQTWLLFASELRQELRSFEVVATAAFYSLVMLALFALSLGVLPRDAQVAAAPGALWLSVAFVGALTLTRVFDREREADTLRALLCAPVQRLAIYFAKGALVLVVLAVAVAVLVPGLALLFPAASALLERPWLTAGLVLLGCIGYVAVGTLFAAGLATSGGRTC